MWRERLTTVRTKHTTMTPLAIGWIAVCVPTAVLGAMLNGGLVHATLDLSRVVGVAFALGLGLAIAIVALREHRLAWRSRRGIVAVDDVRLLLGKSTIVDRRNIRHAFVAETNGRTVVRLAEGLRLHEIEVENGDDGVLLLRDLRVASDQSVGSFILLHGSERAARWRLGAVGLAGAAILAVSLLFGPMPPGWATPFAAAVAYASLVARSFVYFSVGRDGVSMRRGLGRRVIVPMARSSDIVVTDRDIAVRDEKGRWSVAHAPRARGWFGVLEDAVAASDECLERVESAMNAGTSRLESTTIPALRSRDAVAEWMESLAEPTHTAFRTRVVHPDDLWRIVEAPRLPPTIRVGAALKLRRELDESGRQRLRAAGDSSIAPRLRVALDAVATRDLHSIRDAIQDLADEESDATTSPRLRSRSK